jgi:hypothetical protein
MENYPEVVAKIADDYVERVKTQLRLVPRREQEEFLREIRSHIYEAYQLTPGEDHVARILAVLRKLGEPADVVADRMPGAIVQPGGRRNLPMLIVGGLLLALVGIPLGFGGAAVLASVLVALTAAVVAYHMAAAAVFLSSAVLMLLGLARIYKPDVWERLVAAGIIHIDNGMADFLDQIPTTGQGLFLILIACALAATSVAMLWLGRYLVRGLRFVFSLSLDWLRKFGQSLRSRREAVERQTSSSAFRSTASSPELFPR